MKRILWGVASLLALTLAGCSSKLTTNQTTYHPTALTAVIKGSAGTKTVNYQIDHQAQKKAAVKTGTYFFQVPATTRDQTVKITAGTAHKTVTVKKVTALADYATFVKTYNQAMTASYLPTKVQKQLETAAATKQKLAALAKTNPTAAAAAAQQQQAAAHTIQTAMATAKTKAHDQLLPTQTNGLKNLSTTKSVTVRGNVQNGQLMGLALIVPTKQMETTSGQKAFGTTFALAANTLKANPKYVMKQFKKIIKDAKNNSSSTTTKTIRSHGIRFNTGFSADHLYIYLTK